jgi:hypothetical protein
MWNNVVAPVGHRDNIRRCMWITCWITKATDTHLEYLILSAFPWQQWSHECAPVLHCTNSACLILVLPSLLFYWKINKSIFIVAASNLPCKKINHPNLRQLGYAVPIWACWGSKCFQNVGKCLPNGVISQNSWIFINVMVRTSNFTCPQ